MTNLLRVSRVNDRPDFPLRASTLYKWIHTKKHQELFVRLGGGVYVNLDKLDGGNPQRRHEMKQTVQALEADISGHSPFITRDGTTFEVCGLGTQPLIRFARCLFDGTNRLTQRRILRFGIEQGHLLVIVAVLLADSLHDGARVNPLMNVQRNGRNRKTRSLRLARPNERRVQVGVVSVGFLPLGRHRISRPPSRRADCWRASCPCGRYCSTGRFLDAVMSLRRAILYALMSSTAEVARVVFMPVAGRLSANCWIGKLWSATSESSTHSSLLKTRMRPSRWSCSVPSAAGATGTGSGLLPGRLTS